MHFGLVLILTHGRGDVFLIKVKSGVDQAITQVSTEDTGNQQKGNYLSNHN